MALTVGIIYENMQAATRLSQGLLRNLKKVCLEALREEGKDGLFEIGLTIVDDAQIQEINLEQRGIDAPTDVLSFPLSEDGEHFDINPDTQAYLLGDIVISVERAVEQAWEYGHSFKREMAYLTAHSMFHLLGYDHVEGAKVPPEKFGENMRYKEEKILNLLGILREEEETANV